MQVHCVRWRDVLGWPQQGTGGVFAGMILGQRYSVQFYQLMQADGEVRRCTRRSSRCGCRRCQAWRAEYYPVCMQEQHYPTCGCPRFKQFVCCRFDEVYSALQLLALEVQGDVHVRRAVTDLGSHISNMMLAIPCTGVSRVEKCWLERVSRPEAMALDLG
jgi:hypothetical protein